LDAQESGTRTPDTETEQMARRLMAILEREIDEVTLADDDWGSDSISRLNLSSLALVGFLVAVEDEFSIEWDSDIDVEVLRSFDAMSRYVLDRGGSLQ
jgi:acyl carrier protein